MARSWIIKRIDQKSAAVEKYVSLGTSIALPHGPMRVEVTVPTKSEEVTLSLDLPYVISMKSSKQMVWEGMIADGTKNLAALETSFITPLENIQDSIVVVRAPGSRYDGHWLVDNFRFEEAGGNLMGYKYTLSFRRGKGYIRI